MLLLAHTHTFFYRTIKIWQDFSREAKKLSRSVKKLAIAMKIAASYPVRDN